MLDQIYCYGPASREVELRLEGKVSAKAGRGLEVFDKRETETRQSGQEKGEIN